MNKATKKRCTELDAEARSIVHEWIEGCADDYGGKVMFCMAVAHAVLIMRDLVPGLSETGQDFIDAVKDGVVIWVEAGEPETEVRQ